MGIQGLLPLLKSIHKSTHLRNFAGQTLGVDAYGWLHRGTVACAIELAQGKPSRKYVDFAMHRVRMLIHFGIKPYIVFDGDYLPSKSHTEKDRAARRKESKRLGLELLNNGKTTQAQQELQKAVDVTPLMARELIEELKLAGVDYVVAPYEADSQLAYLEKQGIISGVVSEDSDLLVFGVNCLLTKLDQYGECIMIKRDDFSSCRDISLVGWTDNEFRIMTMLSGCDYLPGIDKMGLKTAYRLVRKHKTVDRIVRTVQFDGKMKVPAGYLEAFTRAEQTFLYQWVFCPEAKQLVNLNKVPSNLDIHTLPFVGRYVEPELACGVAAGDLDPNTKQPLPYTSRQPYPGRLSRSVSTPVPKQGKPISEFFKPKRTPLAELDPNSFTPSPSQQRLQMSQQNVSWSASQAAPLRPALLARADSTYTPASAPQPARRTVSAQTPVAGSPPKRLRLCSDTLLASSTNGAVGLQGATSRFFSKPSAQPSPSLRRKSTKKEGDEFQLWSDDSVAEAMVATADEVAAAASQSAAPPQSPSPRKRKRLSVFADGSKDRTDSQSSLQSSLSTEASQTSQETRGVGTPLTSFSSASSSQRSTGSSRNLAADFARMKSQWAFDSSSPKLAVNRIRSAPVSLSYQKSTVSSSKPTEKQRLEVVLDETVPTIPDSSPVDINKEIQETSLHDTLHDNEEQNFESQISAQGSEDMLLVPESPRSDDDGGYQRPALDLGRFAFVG